MRPTDYQVTSAPPHVHFSTFQFLSPAAAPTTPPAAPLLAAAAHPTTRDQYIYPPRSLTKVAAL